MLRTILHMPGRAAGQTPRSTHAVVSVCQAATNVTVAFVAARTRQTIDADSIGRRGCPHPRQFLPAFPCCHQPLLACSYRPRCCYADRCCRCSQCGRSPGRGRAHRHRERARVRRNPVHRCRYGATTRCAINPTTYRDPRRGHRGVHCSSARVLSTAANRAADDTGDAEAAGGDSRLTGSGVTNVYRSDMNGGLADSADQSVCVTDVNNDTDGGGETGGGDANDGITGGPKEPDDGEITSTLVNADGVGREAGEGHNTGGEGRDKDYRTEGGLANDNGGADGGDTNGELLDVAEPGSDGSDGHGTDSEDSGDGDDAGGSETSGAEDDGYDGECGGDSDCDAADGSGDAFKAGSADGTPTRARRLCWRLSPKKGRIRWVIAGPVRDHRNVNVHLFTTALVVESLSGLSSREVYVRAVPTLVQKRMYSSVAAAHESVLYVAADHDDPSTCSEEPSWAPGPSGALSVRRILDRAATSVKQSGGRVDRGSVKFVSFVPLTFHPWYAYTVRL